MGNVDGRVSSSRPAVKESFAIMDDMEAEGGRRGGGGGGGGGGGTKTTKRPSMSVMSRCGN